MSVGVTLSEARVRAGLSVDDVAAMTCIRRTLVENIEADDFHACGGDFYARGHVKSIAQALHVDPAPLLAEFDGEHHNPDLPTATGVLDPGHHAQEMRGADRSRPNWTAVMAAALVAVVAFGGFQVASSFTGDGQDGSVVAGADADRAGPAGEDTSDASGDASEPSDEPRTAPSDAIAAVPDPGVTVELSTVDGRSWVSATGRDNGLLLQTVLDEGAEETLRDDRQVRLVLGNAGAVRLVVNGQDLGSPGGEGEVVRLSFGPGDPTLATG